MSSNAITEPPPPEKKWQPAPENAPSLLQADEPLGARVVGAFSLVGFVLGMMAIIFNRTGYGSRIGVGLALLMCVVSTVGLLYHAVRDRDVQVRRLYGAFSLLLLGGGLFFSLMNFEGGFGSQFIGSAVPLLGLAGLFLVAFLRTEDEPALRQGGLGLLGGLAVVLAGTGLIGGSISTAFLSPYGLLMTVLGLGYLWGLIEQLPEGGIGRARAGWAMESVGYVVLLVVLVRSFLLPFLFYYGMMATRPDLDYFATGGALLGGLSVLFLAIAYLIASDLQVVILTRRELAAFFYSPTVYFILLASSVIAGLQYANFLAFLSSRGGLNDPIVAVYIVALIPAFTMILIVPLLTMRLLSEEYSSGTMEVLFTGPVGEWPVVTSKLLASLVVFLLTWVPYALYLIALRVELGRGFDYRPLISFSIGLVCSGTAFLAMGLFCSSLTRSQIIAAILSAMGMMVLFTLYFISQQTTNASLQAILVHLSFVDLWQETLQGRVVTSHLLAFLSMAVFWLFLTVKVVESRKWR